MIVICLLACMAWIVGLTWMVLCPIERDRQLSQGKAKNLLLVIAGILTLPMVLTFLLSKMDVEPEELVYSEGMYRKWQPYAFQKDVDSTSYMVANGDTLAIYTPKSFRERQMDAHKYKDPSLLWVVYYQYVNPNRQDMATSSRGRLIAFCLSMLGLVLMTGLLVSLTSNFFQRRIERWRIGQIRYSHGIGRFCVVIGANELLAATLKQIDERYGRRLQHIMVLTSQDVSALRNSLVSELPKQLVKKVVLYAGMQTELTEIKKLRCDEADEVFILGERQKDNAVHDTMNVRCLSLIAEVLPTGKGRLKTHALLNDTTTYAVFQRSELAKEQRDKIEFIPFNIYETWARKVLVENHAADIVYEPLDTNEGIKADDNRYVHLFVAGMSEMGIHLAVEAAHIAHFPNYADNGSLKTIITFIDKDIKEKECAFKARYRELFDVYENGFEHLVAEGEDEDFLDVEWQFLEGDLKNTDLLEQNVAFQLSENTLMTLALCYDNQEETLSTILSLPQRTFDNAIQVLAYQPGSDSIMTILANSHKSFYNKIRPFGMMRSCVDLSHKLIPLSMLVNYAYNNPDDVEMKRAMVDENGNYRDNISELWAMQTTANKWSNVYNSDSIPTKLRSVGVAIEEGHDVHLSEENIAIIAEVEHRRWNMEKLLMGFRALTKEEQHEVLTEGKPAKDRLKGESMAHLDICSLKRLQEIDPSAVRYDKDITRIIPTMIKEHFTPLPDLWK